MCRRAQRQLAERVGYTRQHVSLTERVGHNLPSQTTVDALDAALHAEGALRELRTQAKAEQRARRANLVGASITRDFAGSAPARLPVGAGHDSAGAHVDAGLELGLRYQTSVRATVDAVAVLGRIDVERRKFLSGALFSVAASIAPSRDWLVATLDEATTTRGKVGNDQVDAIRRTFGVFQELDVMRGGGHARAQLAAYLGQVVVPLLRTNDPESDSGRALYSAASEQLYLLGWMAFDNGEHVLAQRYLIQSLRLAEASRSIELGAHVLAGLSDQATLNGHPDQGVQLARTGVAGLQRGRSNACLADLRALQGRAQAAMGDVVGAARSVAQSQQAFTEVDSESEPEWARFIDVAYLNGEYAHVFRDLDKSDEASTYAQLSAEDAARQSRARRGSLAHAAMARAALSSHDLAAATAAGMRAVELAATVKSSRSNNAVKDIRARFQSHAKSPHVAEFFDKSAALMPALG